MISKIFGFVLILLLTLQSLAQPSEIPVYTSGTWGHKSYRIPAILKAPNGDLLAFAEGRVNGSDDFGNIEIVLKRSSDRGKTWGPMTVVAKYGELQAGNPAPVVDLLDPRFPKGRIFLFYNTGTKSEGEVRNGNGVREVWYKTSVDNGKSWSEPVNITLQVHKPNQPGINPDYHFTEDWRSYANTPGHAMQYSSKPYLGRIFVAANHSEQNSKSSKAAYFAHGFYTDDHGISFKLSETVPLAGSNESSAAELSNGTLMLNSRNQKGDIRERIVAISRNGGASWDSVYFDHQLPDPVCEGSILNIGKKNGKNWLAFCNPAERDDRNNLTLRISSDEGMKWTQTIRVDNNPDQKKLSYAAYSDIVSVGKSTIGVLYEKSNYSLIVFKLIKWK